jgi:hypothetical protein
VDNIQLRARLDAIETRLNVLDGDGGRFPSHGTRGSLSRPIVDGGVQPIDVHELNDVPVDRDDDLMPEVNDDQGVDQVATANDDDGVDLADQAAAESRSAATRRRAASTGSRQARKRAPRGRR